MDVCEICEEMGCVDCIHCTWGNPCLGCLDYDPWNNKCTSEGACGDPANKWKGTDCGAEMSQETDND